MRLLPCQRLTFKEVAANVNCTFQVQALRRFVFRPACAVSLIIFSCDAGHYCERLEDDVCNMSVEGPYLPVPLGSGAAFGSKSARDGFFRVVLVLYFGDRLGGSSPPCTTVVDTNKGFALLMSSSLAFG